MTPFITHLPCRKTSYNPHDIEQRYCGFCHRFHETGETRIANFEEGMKVRLSSSHCSRDGVIVMASSNQASLMVDLRGDGVPVGRGVIFGFMPLLYDDKIGAYRDLMTNSQIEVETIG